MQPWWITHLLEFITNTAWPIVVLVIFFNIKPALIHFINRIKNFNFGKYSLEFEVQKIEEAIKYDDPGSVINRQNLDRYVKQLMEQQKNKLSNLKDDPRMLIIDSWNKFEKTLREIYQKMGMDNDSALIRFYFYSANVDHIISDLVSKKYISKNDARVISEIRQLRNRIVHGDVIDFDYDESYRFSSIIDGITISLATKFLERNE